MIQQVLRNSGALLSQSFYSDETLSSADGVVSVTVTNAAGDEVSAGPATLVSTGRYGYALDPVEEVDQLAVGWSGTFDGVIQSVTSQVDIVSGHYFALRELRELPGLTDPGRFPSSKLAEKRAEAEGEIERVVTAAFVERFGTLTRQATGGHRLRLRSYTRRLLSGSMAGVAFTPEEIGAMTVDEDGNVEWRSGWFDGAVVLRFVHCLTTAPPPEIRDMALELARMRILGWRSSLPDQTVDADDLGQQTPAGEAADRAMNQERIFTALTEWRRRQIGPVIA